MNIWKKILIGFGVIIIIFASYIAYIMLTTKSHSPADEVIFMRGPLSITVNYCQPYKKGRVLFGDQESEALVKYGEVWRTGANEATTINFSREVKIENRIIPAGRYTLWTIPGEYNWTIVINAENTPGHWGVKFGGKANYDQSKDVQRIVVSVEGLPREEEQFTIQFEESGSIAFMKLMWGNIMVRIPIGLI